MHLTERLRKSTKALDLSKLGEGTISVGVATWRPSEWLKALVSRVDQAMYQAEYGVRNQV